MKKIDRQKEIDIEMKGWRERVREIDRSRRKERTRK